MLHLFRALTKVRDYHLVTHVPRWNMLKPEKPIYVGSLAEVISPEVDKSKIDQLILTERSGIPRHLNIFHDKGTRFEYESLRTNTNEIVGLAEVLNNNLNIWRLDLPKVDLDNKKKDFIDPFFDKLNPRVRPDLRMQIDWGDFTEDEKAHFIERVTASKAFHSLGFHSNSKLISDPVAKALNKTIVQTSSVLKLNFPNTAFKLEHLQGLATAFKFNNHRDGEIYIGTDDNRWTSYCFDKEGVLKIVSEENGDERTRFTYDKYIASLQDKAQEPSKKSGNRF